MTQLLEMNLEFKSEIVGLKSTMSGLSLRVDSMALATGVIVAYQKKLRVLWYHPKNRLNTHYRLKRLTEYRSTLVG